MMVRLPSGNYVTMVRQGVSIGLNHLSLPLVNAKLQENFMGIRISTKCGIMVDDLI